MSADRYDELCSLLGQLWRRYWHAARADHHWRKRRLRDLIACVESRLAHAVCSR